MKKKISEEKCKQFLEKNGFVVANNKIYYNLYYFDGKVEKSGEFVEFDEIIDRLNDIRNGINPGCDVDVILTILFEHKDELLED